MLYILVLVVLIIHDYIWETDSRAPLWAGSRWAISKPKLLPGNGQLCQYYKIFIVSTADFMSGMLGNGK